LDNAATPLRGLQRLHNSTPRDVVPSLIPLIRKYGDSLKSNFFVSSNLILTMALFAFCHTTHSAVSGAALIDEINRGGDVFIDHPECAIASQENKPVAILRYVTCASWQSKLKRMFWSLQW
jgi:hypothetical protein